MSYALQADLIDRYGTEEITDVSGDGSGVLDSTRVSRALADAEAEIDASLAGRYTLPLAEVPALLKRLACELAREALYLGPAPEHIVERAKQARALLASIAAGKMRFEIPEVGGAPAPSSPPGAVFHAGRPSLTWPE